MKTIQIEEQYRSLVESMPDVVTRWDKELKLVFANKALEEKLGISKESLYGKDKSEMGLPDEIALPWMESFREVFRTGQPLTYYSPFPARGKTIFFDTRIVPEKNQKGEIITVLSIARDITELKRTQEELEENNSLLVSLLENTSSSLVVLKALRDKKNKVTDFEYLYTNTQAGAAMAVPLIGKKFKQELPGTLPSGLFDTFKKVVETGDNWNGEVRIDLDDEESWAQVFARRFEDGVLVIYTDINEKKKTEYELVELRLKQQREVLNAIILAQEEERERIGEALHDGVAQLLYGAQTRIQALNPVLSEDQKNIKEILAIISDAINDTRRISFELVPAVLKDYGIEVALKALFQRIIKDKPKISVHVKGLAKRLPEKLEYATYRVVQELVSNILKHSMATEAMVDIRFSRKMLTITISDNGIGIREHAEERIYKGIGLQSIKNRIKLMEGSFKIQSSSSTGTTIFISIPVK